MAYASGTASNYLDLLDKLRLFASTNATLVADGEEWAVERWTGGNELILRGPGVSGDDEIYAGFQGYFDSGADYYNWAVRGFKGYISGDLFASQPGASRAVYLPLWNSSIPYWFVGNGDRLIVVAKVSTVYEIMHVGRILPYGTPEHFPAPILIAAGTGTQATRWSATADPHSNLTRPRGSSSTSCGVFNHVDNNWYDYTVESNSVMRIAAWPWFWHSTNAWTELQTFIDVNPDGSYTVEPAILVQDEPSDNLLGEINGIGFVTGQGNAAENTVTIDGTNWLVVPNIYRSTRDAYCAVKLA